LALILAAVFFAAGGGVGIAIGIVLIALAAVPVLRFAFITVRQLLD
jgi:hypothetical protein